MIRTVVRDGVEGDIVECGVWRGGTQCVALSASGRMLTHNAQTSQVQASLLLLCSRFWVKQTSARYSWPCRIARIARSPLSRSAVMSHRVPRPYHPDLGRRLLSGPTQGRPQLL